jgi:predicted TIM-barrel fold metal-dependent hydrolase
MEVIDAQIHQPEPHTRRQWPPEVALAAAAELAREAMDAVGVDVALVNAPERFIDTAVARHPDRFVGAGSVRGPIADADEFVATYRERPGRVALRVYVNDWTTGALTPEYGSGALDGLFRAAETYGVPLFVAAQGQPAAVRRIAGDHPGLTIVLDHLGLAQPPPNPVRGDPWQGLPGVLALATLPNVTVKFCGGLVLSRLPYPHADVWPRLMALVDAFGPGRLMWASDFTRMRMAAGSTALGPRRDWLTTYLDSLCLVRDTPELGEDEKAQILGGTLRRLLRLPADVGSARPHHDPRSTQRLEVSR